MDFVINVARIVTVLVRPSMMCVGVCVCVAIVIFSAQFSRLGFVTVFQLPASLFCVPLLLLLLSIILPTEFRWQRLRATLRARRKKILKIFLDFNC